MSEYGEKYYESVVQKADAMKELSEESLISVRAYAEAIQSTPSLIPEVVVLAQATEDAANRNLLAQGYFSPFDRRVELMASNVRFRAQQSTGMFKEGESE
jgi:cell fate regulator YaaT (PSP1 superfamily)